MKKIFLSLMVWFFFFSGTYSPPISVLNMAHPLAQGLVAFYYLDEGGGQLAFDKTNLNNPGILTSGATFTNLQKGSCVSLDGTDDYVNLAQKKWVTSELTGPISIVALIKPTNFTNYGTIVARTGTTGTNIASPYSFFTTATTGALTFHKGNGTATGGDVAAKGIDWNDAVSTSNVTANVWSQVAVTMNGSNNGTVNFYIKGVNAGSSTLTFSNACVANGSDDAHIGDRISIPSPLFFIGSIKYVMLYQRALSQTEIQALYKNIDQIFINN